MRSSGIRARRRESIKRRAYLPGNGIDKCAVAACCRPTQRAAGDGLSTVYCKRHKEHLRRHGSAWRKSYSRLEIEPFRKAAAEWIEGHEGLPVIRTAVHCLQTVLEVAGHVEPPAMVRWLPPERKADVALARFRDAGKGGMDLLHIALTIEAAYRELGPRANPEFLHVQIAKLVHRVGSGFYPVTSLGRKLKPSWPRAEGNMMRVLGKRVRKAARVFEIEEAVEAVIKGARG